MREYVCGLNLATTLAKRRFSVGALGLAAAICMSARAEHSAPQATPFVQPGVEKAITISGRVQRTAPPNVFGTVAVPFGTTPMSARWTRVLSASANDASLHRLTAFAQDLRTYQKIAFINSAVNRSIRNHSSPKCTDDGYWASARESLARGAGDCVDIAVAKMEALRQLEVPARDMFLITGRKFANSLDAALLVRVSEQFYLLDPHSSQIVEAGHESSFTPVVTYGEGMTWAHGVRVGNPRVVTKPPSLARTAQSAQPSVRYALDEDAKPEVE